MSSLKTAVSILQCFSADTLELAVSDAAKRLAVPKSTVSRLMKTMADCGLVEQHRDTKRYRVGLLPLRLGQLYQAHVKVLEMAEAGLERLVDETGFTGYIGVLDRADIVILRIRHGRYPVRIVLEPGYRAPAFVTAFGKALLARLSDDGLYALLPSVLTYERTALRRPIAKFISELGTVRRRLWAEAREETFPGIGAIGAAIGSADQQQPVGLSLSFPINAVTPRQQQEMIERLVAIARSIAARTADPVWETRSDETTPPAGGDAAAKPPGKAHRRAVHGADA